MLINKRLVKNGSRFNDQSGKSLIEVVLVLVILTIVATFAVAQYRSSKGQFERQNIARQLKISFERARFDSVKRRTADSSLKARVIVDQTWFSLVTDANGDGDLDTKDQEITSFSNVGVSITGQSMVFPVTLYFDQRGNVEAKGADGVSVNPVFYVCNGSCTYSTVTASNSNIVLVSTAGTVNLLAGGTTLPNFTDPTVTDVAGSTDIKSTIVVSGTTSGTTATPTPTATTTATATPTATATATATPTPTTTATPTPTATATPTPTATATPVITITPTPAPTPTTYVCTSGQKPSLTGCACVYPMTVKTNGKCT